MDNELSKIILIATVIMVIMLFIALVALGIVLAMENRKKRRNQEEKIPSKKSNTSKETKKVSVTVNASYNKQSIFDFMEFDNVVDNMISQKSGRRYIMVVECQGVNYDLMSSMEKVSVEEGFQQFLNTLRHPIQIYIQTRTINLESSIIEYRKKVKEVEDKYNKTVYEYNRMQQSAGYTKEQLDAAYFNLTKQRNLYEYAKDIVDNTERMSLNKNILSKKYYVVLSYMPEEASSTTYDAEELRNIAFSELYTKCQALIRTLSGCSVIGKILDSSELVDLLYVAYNRDDSEIFGLDKAKQAEYENMYSTAPDVFEKKMKILDKEIEDRSIDLANTAIDTVRAKSRERQIAEEKEKRMDDLIAQMAQMILDENRQVIGNDVANEAIEEIKEQEKQKKEGGNKNEKEQKTTTRRRTKSN